jgi:hypothetical protein
VIDWVIERWDFALHEFMDPTNFPEGDVDPEVSFSLCYDSLLTLHRLFMTCIYMLTARSPFVAKILAFQVLDQIASLRDPKRDAEEFKRVFLDAERERLAVMLDKSVPWIGRMACAMNAVGETLVDEVTKGVWRREAVEPSGIRVRSKKGTAVLKADQYCAFVMREMRNTLHGYSLSATRERASHHVLEIYRGGLPEEVVDVALFQVLMLLADPGAYLKRKFWGGEYPMDTQAVNGQG